MVSLTKRPHSPGGEQGQRGRYLSGQMSARVGKASLESARGRESKGIASEASAFLYHPVADILKVLARATQVQMYA